MKWNPKDHPRGKSGLFKFKGAKKKQAERTARVNSISRRTTWSSPLPPDPFKAVMHKRTAKVTPAKKKRGAFSITSARKPRKARRR